MGQGKNAGVILYSKQYTKEEAKIEGPVKIDVIVFEKLTDSTNYKDIQFNEARGKVRFIFGVPFVIHGGLNPVFENVKSEQHSKEKVTLKLHGKVQDYFKSRRVYYIKENKAVEHFFEEDVWSVEWQVGYLKHFDWKPVPDGEELIRLKSGELYIDPENLKGYKEIQLILKNVLGSHSMLANSPRFG